MGTICASVGVRVRVCTCALPLGVSVQGMVCIFVTRQGYTRSVEPGASALRTCMPTHVSLLEESQAVGLGLGSWGAAGRPFCV